MNAAELLALYDIYERQGEPSSDQIRETTESTIRTIPRDGDEGWVMYSKLDETTADAAIKGEIARFAGLGKNFEWKWYSHDQPADLCDRLAAHGFEIGDDEAIMAVELANLPAALREPVTLDVRRLTDPDQLVDVAAVHEAVWNERVDDMMAYLRRDMLEEPSRFSIYVTYIDNQPACAAWIRFPVGTPFASLWGGATLPHFRQRGAYTANVAARAQEAIQRGYQYLTIDASPMSRPIVAKHGFQVLTMSRPCKWHVNTPA